MKSILPLLLVATLAACSRTPASVVPELGERVLTVDEYLAAPNLRKKVNAACDNDPGRTGLDANCINAGRAEHIAAFGSLASVRLDP